MKKKVAIFCPVKDETIFSPIWLKYYSAFFPKEDIYFLDFGSKNVKYDNIIKCDKNICDADELFDAIKSTHSELLKYYEYVIPTDVDEILFHESGLGNFINNLSGSCAKAKGYELIHMPENDETDIDLSKPILSQRNYWFRSEMYDKTLIANKPLNWSIGLHQSDEPLDFTELILLHLHRFDYNLCIKRHLEWSKKQWSDNTIGKNLNWHYRMGDEDLIKNWYFSTGRIFSRFRNNPIVEIPEAIKNMVNI